MAEHDETTPEGGHGRAIAGHGKKGGVLNGPHREMIIMVASVVGVGLAYVSLRKGGGSSGTQVAASTLTPTGSLGSGSVAGSDSQALSGLQTLLANQSAALANLEANVPTGAGSGAPPATPNPLLAAPGVFGAGVYKVAGSGDGYYYIDPNAGTRDWLGQNELADLGGAQGASALSVNNPVWTSTKLVGGDAPDVRSYFPQWDPNVPQGGLITHTGGTTAPAVVP